MTSRKAIFYPLISLEQMKWFIFFACAVISLLALFLPRTIEDSGGFIRSIFAVASTILDVSFMSQKSSHPVALTVSYGASLIIAPLLALLLCFSELHMDALKRLTQNKTVLQRVVAVAFAMLMVLAPFFIEPIVQNTQLSNRFFDGVGSNRLLLLIWVDGCLLYSITFWTWCFYEITNIARGE